MVTAEAVMDVVHWNSSWMGVKKTPMEYLRPYMKA